MGQLNRLRLVSQRCIWSVGLNKKNSTACIRIIWLKRRHLTSGLTNYKNLWHCCNNDLTMKPSLWCLLGWNVIHLYLLLCFIEAIEKCVQVTSCTDRCSDMQFILLEFGPRSYLFFKGSRSPEVWQIFVGFVCVRFSYLHSTVTAPHTFHFSAVCSSSVYWSQVVAPSW